MRFLVNVGTTKHGLDYAIKILDENDYDKVSKLQKKIIKEISDPIFYDPVIEDDISKLLTQEGRILGTFVKGRLVAFCIMRFPGLTTDNLGNDIGLPEKELSEVAVLASVVVDPEFRRNGFAYNMNVSAIKMINDLEFKHIFSTVYPYNYPNILTLLKTGLIIKNLKQKYANKLRYIFYQNIQDPLLFEGDCTKVKIHDLTTQKKLLDQGYVGHSVNNMDEMSYSKVLAA